MTICATPVRGTLSGNRRGVLGMFAAMLMPIAIVVVTGASAPVRNWAAMPNEPGGAGIHWSAHETHMIRLSIDNDRESIRRIDNLLAACHNAEMRHRFQIARRMTEEGISALELEIAR